MSKDSQLGGYLRARRELVRPEDAGLAPGERRRVPGLRREEVAMLAGISADYYLRLEQGRDEHPSVQVLDALARVLLLDGPATAYLHRLATPSRRRPARRAAERVSSGLSQLLTSLADTPAFVQGRYQDVLAANPLATALNPCYRPGVNLVRAAFLDPQLRDLYENWGDTGAAVVASLRALAGPDAGDPHLTELVGELSLRSEEFRRLWARQDVRPRVSGSSVLRHPQVGRLELNYEKLAVSGAPGQVLVIYHAAQGSETARSLALLASLAASDHGVGLPVDARPDRA